MILANFLIHEASKKWSVFLSKKTGVAVDSQSVDFINIDVIFAEERSI